AFPAITDLSSEEQDLLCKNYFPKFCLIDNAHRTRMVWGEIKTFAMCSVMSAVDLTRPDLWLGEERGEQHRKSIISTVHAQYEAQFPIFVPTLVRAQITTMEFYAVIALTLCENASSSHLSEQTLSVLDDIRAEILEDLQRYYKDEIGLSDFSTRLGNLITVSHVIQECVSLSEEFAIMQHKLFDLYANDDF
ncbi:hypothetical protein PFISCL1PPCAC_13694, partial [Pristionchus fissidentatus]